MSKPAVHGVAVNAASGEVAIATRDPLDAIHKRLSPLLIYLTGYAFLLSFLYLQAFWGTFTVNVFEYLGINDVVKTGLVHLGWLVAFVAGALSSPSFWSTDEPIAKRSRFDSWLRERVRRHRNRIIFVWVVAAVIVTTIQTWWLLLSLGIFVIGVPMAVALEFVLRRVLMPEKWRFGVCAILAILPLAYYSRGLQDAASIRDWDHYQCVAPASLPGLFLEPKDSAQGCIRYVGVADGYLFLLMNDSTTFQVMKLDQAKGLRLLPGKGRPPVSHDTSVASPIGPHVGPVEKPTAPAPIPAAPANPSGGNG